MAPATSRRRRDHPRLSVSFPSARQRTSACLAQTRAAAAAGIDDRVATEQEIVRVEAIPGGRGRVLQDCIGEAREETRLRARLVGGDKVAPAHGRKGAGFWIPDDEVTEDADGAVGVEGLSAPAERDTDLGAVVGCERRVGEGVVIVPDGELVDAAVIVGRIDLDDLDVGVGEAEASRRAGP